MVDDWHHPRRAPVGASIEELNSRPYHKGDLGSLVNLNSELLSRCMQARDSLTHHFDDVAVGVEWFLRVQPDGAPDAPIARPDTLSPDGRWRERGA